MFILIQVQVSSPGFGKHSLYLWEPTIVGRRTELADSKGALLPEVYYDRVGKPRHLISVSAEMLFFRIMLELWNNTQYTFSNGKYI